MILYSIMPVEVVFGNAEENKYKYTVIEYMGEKIQVMEAENNRYVIDRLLSTSPQAYLNPKLQPGTILEGIDIRGK